MPRLAGEPVPVFLTVKKYAVFQVAVFRNHRHRRWFSEDSKANKTVISPPQEVFVAFVNEDDSNETPQDYDPPVIGDTVTFPLSAKSTTIGAPCPATKMLGADNPKLESLRTFRDSKLAQSALGRKVIQMYYTNSGSINDTLDRNPVLQALARRMLEMIAPLVGNN